MAIRHHDLLERARYHWHALALAEKREAIYLLALSGFGDYAIAAATGASVEQVRLVLAERAAAES